jgi:hypothetical protein
MDQHERAALDCRLAELEARLHDLEHPHSSDHVPERVKVQIEMGELLRTIDRANEADCRM